MALIISNNEWAVYTLTAGTHAADETHFIPLDYDAVTNAKHWVETASGTIIDGEFITLGGERVTLGGEDAILP